MLLRLLFPGGLTSFCYVGYLGPRSLRRTSLFCALEVGYGSVHNQCRMGHQRGLLERMALSFQVNQPILTLGRFFLVWLLGHGHLSMITLLLSLLMLAPCA